MKPLFIARLDNSSMDDESDFSSRSFPEMFQGNHNSTQQTRCSSGMSVPNSDSHILSLNNDGDRAPISKTRLPFKNLAEAFGADIEIIRINENGDPVKIISLKEVNQLEEAGQQSDVSSDSFDNVEE